MLKTPIAMTIASLSVFSSFAKAENGHALYNQEGRNFKCIDNKQNGGSFSLQLKEISGDSFAGIYYASSADVEWGKRQTFELNTDVAPITTMRYFGYGFITNIPGVGVLTIRDIVSAGYIAPGLYGTFEYNDGQTSELECSEG